MEQRMTADNRTSQADTYSGNRPEGGPDLSAMTFFSERRSLFFIALLYFSDSLLIFPEDGLRTAQDGCP